jgi:hypothetical protein
LEIGIFLVVSGRFVCSCRHVIDVCDAPVDIRASNVYLDDCCIWEVRFCKNSKSSEYPEYPEYVVEVFMKSFSGYSLRELSTVYNRLFTTDLCKRIELMSIYSLFLFGLRYKWNM